LYSPDSFTLIPKIFVMRKLLLALIFILATGLPNLALAQHPSSAAGTEVEKPWPRVGFKEIATIPKYCTDAVVSWDGTNRFFVTERMGRIWIVQNGQTLPEPFLDLSAKSRTTQNWGVLSVAFPPDFKTKQHFYVFYTPKDSTDCVIARFKVDPQNPNKALPESEELIIAQNQPNSYHLGGKLLFGRDGMLYFGFGDGGPQNDPDRNAQNMTTLHSKMIRIDVEGKPDAGLAYHVPSDNPFVHTPGARPEIWALGLRVPWRWSFDSANGDMYIGDVGQDLWEEIDYAPGTSKGGENYGWSAYEGTHAFVGPVSRNPNAVPPYEQPLGTDWSKLVFPAAEFSHKGDGFICITGGWVYRGTEYPAWQGIYFFGDHNSNQVWAMRRDAEGIWRTHRVDPGQTPMFGTPDFTVDEQGNIYCISYGETYDRKISVEKGMLYKLVERPAGEN